MTKARGRERRRATIAKAAATGAAPSSSSAADGTAPPAQGSLHHDDSNALIMPATRAKEAKAPAAPVKKAMSTKQKRRMQAFVEKQLKKEKRVDLMERLSKSTFAVSDTSLLRSTRTLGKKDSQKDRLRRALMEERAGMPRSDASARLYVGESSSGSKRTHDDVDAEGDDHDDDDEATDDNADADDDDDGDDDADGNDAPEDSDDNKNDDDDAETPHSGTPMLFTPATVNGSSAAAASEQKRRRKPKKSSSGTSAPVAVASSATSAASSVKASATAASTPSPTKSATSTVTKLSALMPPAPPPVPSSKRAFYVPVHRRPEVQAQRMKLPIIAEEQIIMETIAQNPFTIIAGETGSGKTTQVPQFLYEAGYGNPESDHPGKIGITQPRRVAAVSMTSRVAKELNVPKDVVSYQIRYDGTVSASTIVQFMTDGVLLKEIASDFLLKQYSVILLDEAHERNLNTDILIGLLSRLVPLRDQLAKEGKVLGANGKPLRPLKVVIMSATLRIEDFTENRALFPRGPPPVIKIEARQFPVTIHFNKRTPLDDYVTEAYNKVCKIHKRLPPGGILVFVTGRNEIDALCRKLRVRFPSKTQPQVDTKASKDRNESEDMDSTATQTSRRRRSTIPVADEANETVMGLDEDGMADSDGEEAEVLVKFRNSNAKQEEKDDDDDGSAMQPAQAELPLFVLPLYALLSPQQQMRVFDPVPEGHRLCVIATNVAETSITIPDIKYVVDTGKAKERHHDAMTGIQAFRIEWISKASADQRAGRAGRTAPGHCYRLYSSAVFGDYFPQFSTPEIRRIPIEATVLLMKSMNIDNVINFPFATPPDRNAVSRAEKLLVLLGAVNDNTKTITAVGRKMAAFPLSPRYAKMIVVSDTYKVMEHIISLVAMLAVGEPFIRDIEADESAPTEEAEMREERRQQRAQYRRVHQTFAPDGDYGDLHKLLKVVAAYDATASKEMFCDENLLRYKTMVEFGKLRNQLTNIADELRANSAAAAPLASTITSPTSLQNRLISQVVLYAFVDQIAQRQQEVRQGPMGPTYRALATEEPAFIHPTSVLSKQSPQMVVYTELNKTKRVYIQGVTAISPKWLPKIAPTMCYFGKPLDNPPPRYDAEKDAVMCHVSPTFGPLSWPLPPLEIVYPPATDLYRHFARFLLEGVVCAPLAAFVPSLVSKPSTVNKTWTQTKIVDLVQSLQQHKIASRSALETMWQSNPSFLYTTYISWVDASQHNAIRAIWPPIRKPTSNTSSSTTTTTKKSTSAPKPKSSSLGAPKSKRTKT